MKFILALLALALGGVVLYQYTAGINNEAPMTNDNQAYTEEDHDHADDVVNTDAAPVPIAPDVWLAPISHASAVVGWLGQVIYADPVGEASTYLKYGAPDLVFITHRHGDHFDAENLPAMLGPDTTLIAPQDVIDQLPEGIQGTVISFNPGETLAFNPLTLEAIPAYNVRAEAQNYHPKDRGDIGIILDDGTSRVYFSGDTEGTEEMRALTDIDVAFVSMNLPYTMDVDAAADAVLAFAPGTVYPYHFRTPDGFSDVERFRELVNAGNPDINVVILDWYGE